MKRKMILAPMIVLLTLFALPVLQALAAPTNGQKVPVTIKFNAYGNIPGERWDTNGGIIQRRDFTMFYHVSIIIDGAPPLLGECVAMRDSMFNTKEMSNICREYYVVSFPSLPPEDTFEGNGLLLITDYNPGPPVTFNIMTHGLFHGTGAFEGQTINAGYSGPFPGGPGWTGYLLKP